MIQYVIYHINVLLSSIINHTNKNVALTPKEARESHHTGTQALNGSHNAFDVRSAKQMKPLNPGEGVRIRQGKLWKPAIVRKKTNDRSYIVETQDGGSYRHNRRHLLKSNEKPFQLTDPPDFTPSLINIHIYLRLI